MSKQVKATAVKWGLIVGGALVVLYVARSEAQQAAKAIGQGINPTNPENWFYSMVNAVGDAVDDGGNNNSFSLGSWIYDLVNPEDGKP